ncbi:MAG: NAD(P)-binding protein [Pyrinomonadaceae bacterium]
MTTPQSVGAARKKLAVLGGGVSSIAAIYQLTSEPGWEERWDITVYQLGWRIGGKGACGRNLALQDRIEEHGLHVWFGFYDNAFRVMRDCYEKLGRSPEEPLATLEDAFKGVDEIVLQEQVGSQWIPWILNFPPNDEKPGTGGVLLSPMQYVKMILEMIADFAQRTPHIKDIQGTPSGGLGKLVDRVKECLGMEVEKTAALTMAMLAALMLEAARRLPDHPTAEELERESKKTELISSFVHKLANRVERLVDDAESHVETELRRVYVLLNLSAAVVHGIIRDYHLLEQKGWHGLDDQDYKAWLKSNGASQTTLDSPVTNLTLFSTFSHKHPVAAGTYLYAILRGFFTYKGASFYKMQAGMGDAVFGPFYEVLRQRGVRFEYFHRVASLQLSSDKKSVEAIDMRRQVSLTGGDGAEYQPLVNIKGLPCWPSEPLWDQIANASQYKGIKLESYEGNPHEVPLTLRRGVDFDAIVYGISAGALPLICKELIEDTGNPKFKEMVESMNTAATAGLQLWLKPDMQQLGWDFDLALMETYAPIFNAGLDMTDLLPRESWENVPPAETPHACYYFSGDVEDDEDEDTLVLEWLSKYINPIWPKAAPPPLNQLDWNMLVDLDGGEGVERLKAQYLAHNPNPSDRYVRCTPESAVKRLSTDESGYDNLFLTGDWTMSPMNLASVEGSVMAGLRTANALLGRELNDGIVH